METVLPHGYGNENSAMTPREEQQIRRFGHILTDPIHLSFIPSGAPDDNRFREFCEGLSRSIPLVRIDSLASDPAVGPAIGVGDRVVYRAIPEGREMEPFLQLLAARSTAAPDPPKSVRKAVDAITVPADIKVYISPECPFCPKAVAEILTAGIQCDRIRVTIIDGTLFPDLAAADAVRTVPTVILDDRFRWSGDTDTGEILRMMSERDPSTLGAASLTNMLGNGEAERVARMMLEADRIFPALIDLLIDERWPVRLGAMVTVEMLAESNRKLAARIIAPLWERFPEAPDPAKGDILHVFQETDCRGAENLFKSVVDGPYSEEVRAAAAEGIEQAAETDPDSASQH